MKPKYFIPFLLVLVSIFIIIVAYQYYNAKSIEKELEKKGLKLNGIVTSKSELTYGHDFGFATLNIINSNYTNYDPRKVGDDYFFVIRDKKCALLIPGISTIEIGDSLSVAGSNFNVFRDNKLIKSNAELTLLPNILMDDPEELLKPR